MKTRTQLLAGILGLSAFASLPLLAQANPTGDSSNSTAPSTAEAVPMSPNSATETLNTSGDTAPATKNVVEQAASSDQFQTLAKAIEAADLKETLAGDGPYTVFAPTDEAFAALPEEALQQLLQPENKEVLVQLLSYHVVPGAITSSQIQPGDVETLAGGKVAVQRAEDGTVSVNNAKVTQADIQASNGVIHEIDQVILPTEVQAQLQTAPKPVSQNQ